MFNAVKKQQQGSQEDTEKGRRKDKQTAAAAAKAKTAKFLDLLQPSAAKLKQVCSLPLINLFINSDCF